MRICHSSDLHGYWDKLFELNPKPDVFIFTGDMFHNKYEENPSERDIDVEKVFQKKGLEKNLPKLIKLIGNIPVIVIDGNHDFIEFGFELKLRGFNCTDVGIECQTVKELGVTVAGYHNINYINNEWNYETSKLDMKMLANQVVNNNPDWLITHTPPYNIMDTEYHYGCQGLETALLLKRNDIKCHFFGHCHSSNGCQTIKNILFSNAATVINMIDTSSF